jgi:Fe-S-cluster containining protein
MVESAVGEVMKGFNPIDIAIAMRFSYAFCEKCGKCCRVCDPIVVSERDIRGIASYLGIGKLELIGTYTKQLKDGRTSLKTKPCLFLLDNRCTIYIARPSVCRQFPMTPLNGVMELHDYCSFTMNLMVEKANALVSGELMVKRHPELEVIREYFKQCGSRVHEDLGSQLSFANEIIDAVQFFAKAKGDRRPGK